MIDPDVDLRAAVMRRRSERLEESRREREEEAEEEVVAVVVELDVEDAVLKEADETVPDEVDMAYRCDRMFV